MPSGRTKEQGAPPELIAAGRRTQVLIQDMPRCKARSRRTGKPCMQPAMSDGNGLCRHHGRKPAGRDSVARADLYQWVRSARVPSELAQTLVWQWARDRGLVIRATVLRAWASRDMDNGQAWREAVRLWRERTA